VSDLASVPIVDVIRALDGPEPKHGRMRRFWDNGDNPTAVSVDPDRNIWKDFVSGEGGGVLDLVRIALNTDKAGALRWLEAEGFIEPRETTPAEPAEYARRRTEAAGLAERVACWWKARERELDAIKVAALEREDYGGLQVAASLLHRLKTGGAAAVYRQWREESETHPRETAELERTGRSDFAECRIVAAVVVGLLARAGIEDSNVAA
jgi:hypothetical protein